jgi:subtilisin family serine protease
MPAHHSRIFTLVVLMLSLLLADPSASALASPTLDIGPERTDGSQAFVALDRDGSAAGPRSGGEGTFLVQLRGPSVWRTHAALRDLPGVMKESEADALRAPAALEILRAEIEQDQQVLVEEIEALGGRVLDLYQVTMNGLLVEAGPDVIAVLRAHPSVLEIGPAPLMSLQLDDSVPLIGASRVREQLGYDGEGSIVAVIDTGIDYTHAAFGGAGSVEAYDANDENIIEAGSFPTARVLGGYDFVGQRYSPECPEELVEGMDCHRDPRPDDDPLDAREQGHGSHVAGIVAGGEGEGLAPGVAPAAGLVALKVFGNPIGAPNNTSVHTSAIEWVARHNLGMEVPGVAPEGKIDVINLSLGSTFVWRQALNEEVVRAAVDSGATLVAAACNSGPIPYITCEPAIAEGALSVASSVPSGETMLEIEAAWTENEAPQTLMPLALESGDWLPSLGETGLITGTLAWYGLACNDENGEATPPQQELSERIALIERGGCTFYDKMKNAADQGAVAALLFTDDRDKSALGCFAPSDCENGPGIPGVMVDREPGVDLKELLEAGTEVLVTLDPERRVELTWLTDTISDFSSRGPNRIDGGIKPQITAPGSNIYSAQAGSGDKIVSMSGTSMASPTVAGVAALLWQRNRDEGLKLEALDIAALAMNQADPLIKLGHNETGPFGAIARQGAGRVDAWRSAKASTIARSARGIAELGFGNLQLHDERRTFTRTLSVRNLADAPRLYRLRSELAFPAEDARQDPRFFFEPKEAFEVGAGETRVVTAVLRLDPDRLEPWALRGADVLMDEARFQRQELDGRIYVEEEGPGGVPLENGDRLLVPFHALPRRNACVESTTTGGFAMAQRNATFRQVWDNPCGAAGSVDLSRLVATKGPSRSAGLPAGLDLRAVGLRYGPADPAVEGSPMIMEWHLRTDGARRIPVEAEFDIYFDTNLDGTFDRVAWNVYGPWLNGGLPAGSFVVAQAPVVTGTLFADFSRLSLDHLQSQSFDLDETTAVLRVDADALGIDLRGGAARFGFGLRSWDIRMDGAGYTAQSVEQLGDELPRGVGEGAALIFDQGEHECLQAKLPDGSDALSLGTLAVPAGRSLSLTLTTACLPEEPAREMGLLMRYPSNGLVWPAELRRGFLGTPRIQLPLLMRNGELGVLEP